MKKLKMNNSFDALIKELEENITQQELRELEWFRKYQRERNKDDNNGEESYVV